MSEGQGFVLHPLAAQDITDIWEFLAETNPQAASRVREDILNAIRALVPFPHQGHRRSDLTSRPLRFTVVRDYLTLLLDSGVLCDQYLNERTKQCFASLADIVHKLEETQVEGQFLL